MSGYPDWAIARAEARRIDGAVPVEMWDVDELAERRFTGAGGLSYQFTELGPAESLAAMLGLDGPERVEGYAGMDRLIWSSSRRRGYACRIQVIAYVAAEAVAS